MRVSLSDRGRPDESDWKRVSALTDREIEAAIASDREAAPLLDAEWFRNAKLVMPERKIPVSMRVDREVLDWFRRHGRGYLSRMHAVLRAYVSAHSQVRPEKSGATTARGRKHAAKKATARISRRSIGR